MCVCSSRFDWFCDRDNNGNVTKAVVCMSFIAYEGNEALDIV